MKRYTAALTTLVLLTFHLQAWAQNQHISESPDRVLRGNDVMVGGRVNAAPIAGSAMTLRFEDAPLADVTHTILREVAKVDYILHPPLTGTVTMATQGDVTLDQAVLMLEYALQSNGFMLARDTRGVYHVGRADALKGFAPITRLVPSDGGPPPGYSVSVIPLRYIGASEMASILRPLVPAESITRVDAVRNLVVLTGSRPQIEGWLELIRTFDVDLLKGMSVAVFPLRHLSTKDVDAALRALGMTGGGATGAASAGAVSTPPNPATSRLPDVSGLGGANFPLFGVVRLIPIERINSVLVVTPRAAYLDEARRWLDKLDVAGANVSEGQLFVYRVKNGSAAHLTSVLSGLFGDGGGAGAAAVTSTGVAPTLRPTTIGTATAAASATATGGNSTAGGGGRAQGGGTFSLGGGVRVMADDINNAVLVYATRNEFQKIEAALSKLDVAPAQVLISASIIEVTLTDDLQYGLQWAFSDAARGAGNLTGAGLLSKSGGAISTAFGGFTYTLRNPLGDIRAVLNALAEKSLVKVISNPSLMVLDNHTASIVVGNQQPVKLGETVTTGGNITSNIQYKDTGVSLAVSPSVSADNVVTMAVNQLVSDVGAVDVATGQRSFLQRQINSKVAVQSGETLVLGGLIRDNTTDGKSGLPVLQDLPLVGGLFGSTTKSTNRTELIVLITPQVIRNSNDINDVNLDLRARMQSLDWGWAVPKQATPAAPRAAGDVGIPAQQ